MNYDLALQRMPHRGAMQLIASVLEADQTVIRCQAKPHTMPSYPLRVEGRLHRMAFVELGAQAAAAHASLYGIGTAHVGLLLTLNGVEMGEADPETITTQLEIRAERLHGDEGSARYCFEVMGGDAGMVLSGGAVLSMRASA